MRCARLLLVVTVLLLLAAGGLSAQDKIPLRVKFAPGQELRYSMTMTGVGGLAIAGPGAPAAPGDMFMDMALDLRQKTRSVDEAGVGEVEMLLDSLRSTVQMLGFEQAMELTEGHLRILLNDEVLFDSAQAQPGEANPLAALLGQGIIMRIDPTGKLVGLPQVELLKGLVPGMADLDIDKLLAMGKGDLPSEAVAVGDTWEVVQSIPFVKVEGNEPPAVKTTYKLEKLEQVQGRQCAKIAGTTEMHVTGMAFPPLPMLMGPVQGKTTMDVREMGFKVQQTRWFDYENGLDVKTTWDMSMNMDFHQTMEFEQEGKPQKMQMDLKMEGMELMGDMVLKP